LAWPLLKSLNENAKNGSMKTLNEKKLNYMKKIVLIGLTVGIANLVQAVTITLPSSISFPDATIVQTAYTLNPALNYTGASITFNNVKYTVTGGDNTLNYDLLNANYAAGVVGNSVNNSSEFSDFFQTTSPYKNTTPNPHNLDVLGGQVFTSLNQTQSWTTTFSGQALTDILNDITTYGYFDLGFDANCTYQFNGTVTVDFTTQTTGTGKSGPVPDHAMTVCLLGMSFLGMMVFRRKLALN
jgi:hypothetical protein